MTNKNQRDGGETKKKFVWLLQMDDESLLSFTFFYLHRSVKINNTFISQSEGLKLTSYSLMQIVTKTLLRDMQ